MGGRKGFAGTRDWPFSYFWDSGLKLFISGILGSEVFLGLGLDYILFLGLGLGILLFLGFGIELFYFWDWIF